MAAAGIGCVLTLTAPSRTRVVPALSDHWSTASGCATGVARSMAGAWEFDTANWAERQDQINLTAVAEAGCWTGGASYSTEMSRCERSGRRLIAMIPTSAQTIMYSAIGDDV
jgi:hypothetical protein